jgi:hypothetical protein
MVLQYNMCRIGDSTRCAGQGSNSTEEATIAGSHHPPAIKVGAGVFVWCKELYGLDEVQGSFGPMYHEGGYMEYHPAKVKSGIVDGVSAT